MAKYGNENIERIINMYLEEHLRNMDETIKKDVDSQGRKYPT